MKNLIYVFGVLFWMAISTVTGYYCSVGLHKIGANHITPSDIIACYILPLFIWGILIFIGVEILLAKIEK